MSVCPPAQTRIHHDTIGERKRTKRPPNSGSKVLDNQENEMLFSLIGSEAVSLTAAVVQLLKSDRGTWRIDLSRGVISLVKDYGHRAYFLRIFDIVDEKILWEFKLYKGFRIQSFSQCDKLLAFENTETGQDGIIIGLNFHSSEEAAEFKGHLDRRHAQENKSSISTPNRLPMSIGMNSGIISTPPPNRSFEITQAYGGNTIRGPPMASQGITPIGTMAAHHVPHNTHDNNSTGGSSWFKKDKKKKDKKQRIKKEDISNPTNFQHKAHVGWDQDSGFSNKVYDDDMDEATRNILKAAGLESNTLNEEDKIFVKKFIAKNYDKYVSVGGALDGSAISAPMAYNSPQNQFNQTPVRPSAAKPYFPSAAPVGAYSSSPAAPPPPPTRVESHGIAPARPPPPPPASSSSSRGYAPSRPLPQTPSIDSRPNGIPPPPPPPPSSSSSAGAPPPPPPPPPPSGGIAPLANSGAIPPPPPPPPPPPSGGGAVLASLPPAQPGRSNLLAEIQAGKQLKSVAQQQNSSSGTGDARGDVMAQIRQGAQLKHVDAAAEQERRKSATQGIAGMGGLAGALAKALEERRMNMRIDDSSNDEQDDDEKNEWSD